MAENRRSSGSPRQNGAFVVSGAASAESGGRELGDRNVLGDFSGPHQLSTGQPIGPSVGHHSGGHRLIARYVRESGVNFTGRASELERLSRMLRTATGAVALVSGAGSLAGIGKSELACRVAQESQALFPVQVLVDLRGQSEAPLKPEAVLERVIRALPGGELRLPSELDPLISVYRSLLSGLRALIIADDARDTAQVRALLPPPGSALIVTSRQRLLLQGPATSHSLELDVLPAGEAATLLRTLCPRLSAAQAGELSSRGGYMPLALQLLGCVLRDDPTRQYPDFLHQLGSERAAIDVGHAGADRALDVQAAVAIALRNVDPWSRGALSQLALWNAACEKDAAEAILLLPEHALPPGEVLRRLLRSHLLDYDARNSSYFMHNVVRDLVQLRRESFDEAALRQRHAAYFVRLLSEAETRCQRGRDGFIDGLSRFDRARPHLEAAQSWAAEHATHDHVAAQRTIDLALFGPTLLTQRLSPRSRLRWFEAALSAARKLGDRHSEARLLGHLGLAQRDLGQLPRALDFYEQSLALARTIGDRATEGRALASLGLGHLELRHLQRARECCDASLAIAIELGDRRAEGSALGNLGLLHLELGQAPQAMVYFEQDLAIARELGDLRAEGRALGNLGLANRLSGQSQRALDCYEQHVKIARTVFDRRGEGNSLWNRALLLRSLSRRAEAIAAAEAALRIRDEIGDPRAEKVRTALAAWKSEPPIG